MKIYDVIGYGNALIDITLHVKEAFLKENSFEKGGMHLIDVKQKEELLQSLRPEDLQTTSGGSAANTMSTLAKLKHAVAFVGRVGDDALGKKYSQHLEALGIDFIRGKDGDHTGTSLITLTPDKERTMFTTLGCAPFLTNDFPYQDVIPKSRMLYIEGYLWDAHETIETIRLAIDIAKQHHVPIGFSASDSFCVQRHHKDFLNLLEHDVSLFFCNQAELIALAETNHTHKALEMLSQKAKEYLFVTNGSEGSSAYKDGVLIAKVPANPTKVVDLTGAGDAYAAGIISGFLYQKSPTEMTQMASRIAAEVIGYMGAQWDRLRSALCSASQKML